MDEIKTPSDLRSTIKDLPTTIKKIPSTIASHFSTKFKKGKAERRELERKSEAQTDQVIRRSVREFNGTTNIILRNNEQFSKKFQEAGLKEEETKKVFANIERVNKLQLLKAPTKKDRKDLLDTMGEVTKALSSLDGLDDFDIKVDVSDTIDELGKIIQDSNESSKNRDKALDELNHLLPTLKENTIFEGKSVSSLDDKQMKKFSKSIEELSLKFDKDEFKIGFNQFKENFDTLATDQAELKRRLGKQTLAGTVGSDFVQKADSKGVFDNLATSVIQLIPGGAVVTELADQLGIGNIPEFVKGVVKKRQDKKDALAKLKKEQNVLTKVEKKEAKVETQDVKEEIEVKGKEEKTEREPKVKNINPNKKFNLKLNLKVNVNVNKDKFGKAKKDDASNIITESEKDALLDDSANQSSLDQSSEIEQERHDELIGSINEVTDAVKGVKIKGGSGGSSGGSIFDLFNRKGGKGGSRLGKAFNGAKNLIGSGMGAVGGAFTTLGSSLGLGVGSVGLGTLALGSGVALAGGALVGTAINSQLSDETKDSIGNDVSGALGGEATLQNEKDALKRASNAEVKRKDFWSDKLGSSIKPGLRNAIVSNAGFFTKAVKKGSLVKINGKYETKQFAKKAQTTIVKEKKQELEQTNKVKEIPSDNKMEMQLSQINDSINKSSKSKGNTIIQSNGRAAQVPIKVDINDAALFALISGSME